MRHGQAQQFGIEDSQRALTPTGNNEVSSIAKWFKSTQIKVSHIFVSPYVRAQQTAMIMASYLDCPPEVTTLDFITPMDSAKSFHDYLDGITGSQELGNVLVVSHMPLVSYLVSSMTNDEHSPIFQTAGVAQIQYNTANMSGELMSITAPSDLI